MIDRVSLHRWLFRAGLLGFAALIFFVRLLPIDLGSGRFPGPELVLCLSFAWTLRRPDFVPTPMLALIFLIADMLFQRPPGLWPALVVLGHEFLRGREALTRDLPFAIEWGLVAVVMAAMVVANRMVLGFFLVPQPALGLELIQLLMSFAAYPAVVFLSSQVLGVRRLLPGERRELGERA